MNNDVVTVPYGFTPYEHQKDFFQWAVPEIYGRPKHGAATYASLAWARRHGKDLTAWNGFLARAFIDVGQYVYLLPTQKHAKKVVWQGIDNDGRKFLDYIPKAGIAKISNVELTIELVNGSMIFLLGAENYDSIVGMNAKGMLLSEYSLIPKKAFEYFEPMIIANHGFAWFVQTFRGTNHAWDMWNYVKKKMEAGSPHHYANMVTSEQPKEESAALTHCKAHGAIEGKRFDGSYIFSLENIAHLRERGADEDKILSEYYCDPMAAQTEYYFLEAMEAIRLREQVTTVPWNPVMPVVRVWDLGKDGTAIIFAQVGKDGEPRIIDYVGGLNRTVRSWLTDVSTKPYRVVLDVLPHDAEHEQRTDGNTIEDMFNDEFNCDTMVVPKTSKKAAIDITDDFIHRCLFDKVSTSDLRDALRSYRRKWDDGAEAYANTPVHDWASHPSDAFQQLALAWDDVIPLVGLISGAPAGGVITKYRHVR